MLPRLKLRLLAANGVHEPENVYWLDAPVNNLTDRTMRAMAIASAQAELVHTTHQFSSYVYIDENGIAADPVTLGVPGERTSARQSFYNCLFVLLETEGPKNPSTKYLHGITEGMTIDEGLESGTETLLGVWAAVLQANGVVDSDGFPVQGVRFGHLGRRRKLRIKEVG